MVNLTALAQHIVANKMMADSLPAWERENMLSASFTVFILLWFCFGVGFLLYALHLWLQGQYSPEISNALMGIAILAIGILLCLGALTFHFIKLQRVKKIQRDLKETIKEAVHSLHEELAKPVSENPKSSILLASLAGFAVGEQMN